MNGMKSLFSQGYPSFSATMNIVINRGPERTMMASFAQN
jgi:hypothetical protein